MTPSGNCRLDGPPSCGPHKGLAHPYATMKRDWKSWNHDANGRRVIIIGRYAVVVDSLILFPVRCDVVLLSSLGRGGFDEPRKRPWRDNTVALEQVVVERTASFTDSTEESEGSIVTAISGIRLIRVVRWPVCHSQCRP